MQLTKSFTLKELTRSQYATRNGLEDQFNPPKDITDSLTALCQNILQPLRDAIGLPISVVSGDRSPQVNKAIGGAVTSQHVKGEAADIELYVEGQENNRYLFDKIIEMDLPFDQLISEYGTEEKPDWIHVSYSKVKNRGQQLRAERINGKTVYRPL